MTDTQVPQAHGEPIPDRTAGTAPQAPPEGEMTGLSAEEFSALAERFSAVAPLLRTLLPAKGAESAVGADSAVGESSAVGAGSAVGVGSAGGAIPAMARGLSPSRKKGSNRETLLCALKPYLSPERREMADYLIRVCRIYDTVRELF